MYKYTDNTQSNFLDFNQPIGLHMNPENRWVKMADDIPWEIFEKKYSHLFKGKNGWVAKPLRLALGSLIIQTKYQYSDRELVEKQPAKEKKQEYQDNTDRIDVERAFSLSKRCYGMGLIRTKIYDTTLTSIALFVFVTNLFKIQSRILFTFLWLLERLTHQSADFELEAV